VKIHLGFLGYDVVSTGKYGRALTKAASYRGIWDSVPGQRSCGIRGGQMALAQVFL
jgi:hypothetical protein